MKRALLTFAAGWALAAGAAEQHPEGWTRESSGEMTFTADRVAVDNVTKAAMATGHVLAVSAPFTLRSDFLERDAEGVMTFHDPTCFTTCSNEVGHTHWNVTGEIVYKAADYVIVRNAWVRLYEMPVAYLPYLWYPLELNWGIEWMPGWTSRWGAFLLTKYSYHLLGDEKHGRDTAWLHGNTNFDLREKNGLAFGEELRWSLGDFGRGKIRYYHAWDKDAEDRYGLDQYGVYGAWGSAVGENRYGLSFDHTWQATERDRIFLRANRQSDTHFDGDFFRKGFFEIKSQWQTYPTSGVFWEHLENAFSLGAEVSGRLNDFRAATGRLPEIFLDVNPTPLFGSPIVYETENRLGWLRRDYAEYSGVRQTLYGLNPGPWANYDTVRLDSYHRLTAPMRTCDDLVSFVPRAGFRGTYWGDSGRTDLRGDRRAENHGSLFRSIGEIGATLAARGSGWVDDTLSHMTEPYLDFLAQKAWFTGRKGNVRPYVFDNLDASMSWEDQFAGRGRNLPYSYCGVTPGWRNAWSTLEESGNLRQFLDVDVYAAVMFGRSRYDKESGYGDVDSHKLARLGDPNYGASAVTVMPGVRVKWSPAEDLSLRTRVEYDSDNSRIAYGDAGFVHRVSRDFSYTFDYGLRHSRYWDFSSIPYEPQMVRRDEYNELRYQYVHLGGEYQPLDWLALGPFIRWDVRESELDCVGSWFDYLTDCLGFRLMLKYENEYERVDGYRHKADWRIGFYVYLRAFGAESGNVFSGW